MEMISLNPFESEAAIVIDNRMESDPAGRNVRILGAPKIGLLFLRFISRVIWIVFDDEVGAD